MKIAEIQNGLSHAGRMRNRNYQERSAAADRQFNVSTRPSYGQLVRENMILKQSLRNACRIIAVDNSCANNIDKMA